MAEEITFYTNPMSRGRIVRWILEEIGEPYRTEILDYGTTMKSPRYLAINPMGKVPAVVHRGVVVTEAAAICAYLADAFPAKRLAPAPVTSERGTYYRWLFFAAGPVEAAVTNKSFGFVVPADSESRAGYGDYAHVMDALERALSNGDYILGKDFSAADVYVGSHVGWGMQFGTVEKRPLFERYWKRLAERPAAIRAKQIDDALMPKQAPS
jgi:glutathione S-transferase